MSTFGINIIFIIANQSTYNNNTQFTGTFVFNTFLQYLNLSTNNIKII